MIIRGFLHLYQVITSNAAVILGDRRRAQDERALQRMYRKMATLFFSVFPSVPLETMEALMPAMMEQLRREMRKTSQDPFWVRVWMEGIYDIFKDGNQSKVREIVIKLLTKVQGTSTPAPSP